MLSYLRRADRGSGFRYGKGVARIDADHFRLAQMKTVCIDCRYVSDRPSGIAEVVRGLIEFAPDLAPDLDFLLLRNASFTGTLSSARNVREVSLSQPTNGPATMWWLPRIVDLSAVDLFHATANIMPAGMEIPCVTTVHDIMWLTHPQWCNPSRIQRAFYRHGIRRALRHSDAIATVSGATQEAIATYAPEAADHTFVTLSGVSSDFGPRGPDPASLAKMGVPADRRFVLTVGQYAPYKNHEGALRAFSLAFGNRTDVDFVMLQRMGKRTESLLQLADNLGLKGRLHLIPPVNRQGMALLYSSALALLHPSFCEGFGNPLAEAMACGCPVVTSDVSAMPEVTAGAALLADPNDITGLAAALRCVADKPGQAAAMQKRGLARAAQLSWRDFAAANIEIYRRVFGN